MGVIGNSSRLLAIILSLALLFPLLSGCMQTTVSSSLPPDRRPERKLPRKPPDRVVNDYLSALKNYDFKRAYKELSPAYAGTPYIESYELNMRKGLVDTLDWSLLRFEVMGVRILGDQAFVVAEMGVKYSPPNAPEPKLKNFQVQYLLSNIDKRWVITSAKCISNCEERLGLGMQEMRPLELKPVEEPRR